MNGLLITNAVSRQQPPLTIEMIDLLSCWNYGHPLDHRGGSALLAARPRAQQVEAALEDAFDVSAVRDTAARYRECALAGPVHARGAMLVCAAVVELDMIVDVGPRQLSLRGFDAATGAC
jgi:hypothetical protein